MSRRRLIVLKFGGSVLLDEDTLALAVHEIHRWRREDHRVVAVVSALAGTTEELLRNGHRIAESPADHALAAFLAGGEPHCAALLGLHLDRAGIPARVLTPASIGLTCTGSALDAEPRRVSLRSIEDALDVDDVVVVPGFTGRDDAGRTVVLGRGGSDLTALFLANRLGASRCRLVKDVEGLHEWDPAAPGPRPGCYASVSWDDALRTDGTIVQHKAVQFARDRGIAFELGSLNGARATRVGPHPPRLVTTRDTPRPLRVGLLGFGTVGGGLYELLRRLPDLFEVESILVRTPARSRGLAPERDLLTTDAHTAIAGKDIVVETLGGLDPARGLIRKALESGAHVVTANKAMLAAAGDSLSELARARGSRFLRSAAVGGCTPLLERLTHSPLGVRRIRGVLNGTVNFVLDGLSRRRPLEALLEDARGHGFAEQDTTQDLSGRDAADKLAVIASVLGASLDPDGIECDAVDQATAARALHAAAAGRTLRQVSTLWIEGDAVRARVSLEELGADDPLAATFGEHNAAIIERVPQRSEIVRGKGAGRWPTAESVLGDLLQIAREPGMADAPRRGSASSARTGVLDAG